MGPEISEGMILKSPVCKKKKHDRKKLSKQGIEPWSPRPQRGVLTTIRHRRLGGPAAMVLPNAEMPNMDYLQGIYRFISSPSY